MSLATNAVEVSSHRYSADMLRYKSDVLAVIADEFDELFRGLCGHGQGKWRTEQVSGLDAKTLRNRFFQAVSRDMGRWVYAPVPSELNRL